MLASRAGVGARVAARLLAAPVSAGLLDSPGGVTQPASLPCVGPPSTSARVLGGHDGAPSPCWRAESWRGMAYRGVQRGTPSSSAKGIKALKARQMQENHRKLLKKAGVPENMAASGTTNTPLQGWQPSEGLVAGTPIELPDKDADPTLNRKAPVAPEHSVFDQMKHLDPVFEAVALVPWLPNNDEGKKRRDYIYSSVIDQLETKGWDVRGPVMKVWEGERDLSAVLEGKDSGTQAALTAILYHCKKFDAELGDFREYARRTS